MITRTRNQLRQGRDESPYPLHVPLLFVAGVVMAFVLSSCAPAISAADSTIAVPLNDGARFDLVIDSARVSGVPGLTANAVENAARTVWSESESMRTWFALVDQVVNPRDTVRLQVSVIGSSTESQITENSEMDWGLFILFGLPPNLRYATVNTEVSVTLVDATSNVVLGSGSAEGREQRLGIGSVSTAPTVVAALIAEATQRALLAFIGG